MLEKEFEYFRNNLETLYGKYPDQYLVIKGQKVVLSETTFEKALEKAASEGLKVGTFLIQQCTKDESGFTQTFFTRAIFA